MSDRIRLLEDALTILHNSSGATDPHPLLNRDSLKIKSIIELHAAVSQNQEEPTPPQEDNEESQYIDAFGTLAIRDDGAATFYGRSAGQESILIGETVTSSPEPRSTPKSTNAQISNGIYSSSSPSQEWPRSPPKVEYNQLPPLLTNLSHSFPLPANQQDFNIDYLIDTYLPTYDEALRLCNLYLEQAPWFFGAVTRRQVFDELLPMWYNEAPRPSIPPSLLASDSLPGQSSQNRNMNGNPLSRGAGLGVGTMGSLSPPSTSPMPPIDIAMVDGSSSIDSVHDIANGGKHSGGAHDLALLFVIFCFGALTDILLPAAPENSVAEHYYDLTKVALTLEGVLDRPPSVATVQSLSLMAIYEGLRSGENSIESTWALMGMATKLAQSIGLHRDCARWRLSPAEVQKRRALFWELFITDCWQSLATGRLATFSLPFVDCELPADPDQTLADDGSFQPSFPFWKARFGAECVAAVVQGTLTSRAPKYSIILELDRKVRDMDCPQYAQGPSPEGAGLGKTMSHFMPTNYRELTLLYIHRCFFTHAIRSNPSDPIKSQYAPSFLAGYRSACDLLGSVRKQFSLFPKQIARFWVLWTHAFSATIMLSSVVMHGSKSKVAPAALLEVRSACELFEQAAAHGGRAVKFLPIIQRLQAKAQKVFFETCNGIPPSIPNDIFKSSSENNADDEMSIFGGKTHTVATKVAAPNRAGSQPKANDSPRGSQSPPTGSPTQNFATTNPSFTGVHPSLVNELNGFDGTINAQLQNAYKADSALFTQTLMGSQSRQAAQHDQQRMQQEELQYQRQQEEERQRQLEERQRKRYMQEQEQQRQAEGHSQATYTRHEPRPGYTSETYPCKPDPSPYYTRLPAVQPELSPPSSYPVPHTSVVGNGTAEAYHDSGHKRPISPPQAHSDLRPPTEYPETMYRQDSYPPETFPREIHRNGHYPAVYNSNPTSPTVQYPYHPEESGSGTQNGPQIPPQQPSGYVKHPARPQRPLHAHQPYLRPNHHIQRVSQTRVHRQPQPEMYQSPPSYVQPQHTDYTVSNSASPENEITSPVSATQPYPPHSFEPHVNESSHPQVYHPPSSQHTMQPQHHAHVGRQGEQPYWAGESEGYHAQHPTQHVGNQQPYHQYTPEDAMRGIAADDPRLQETWQAYMYKVGTAQMLED
ncbi:hypothetical protein E1B28_006343 [Marasmius oreades]|uniref:Xylanolytic transcriptional activator regulatory domain-containing protein n=1 Tax=Marasmius oreades TaxID=181124 RepID=A0A9P7S536_9AGAR|nr:uncharacterized protein E1B28_006343 [Marasmius oreades]KAG7095619.1 hypothetical protein E1B28_006343 [Marasmius oreades]